MDSRLKQHALRTARSLGVLGALELVRERWSIIDQRADNKRFCEENPGFIPPPLAAMHDAYGSVSFRVYWSMGQYMAQFVADLINRLLQQSVFSNGAAARPAF